MKKYTSLLVMLLALYGCATTETTLQNAAGEKRYCYLVPGGLVSGITARAQYSSCLNEAGAAGFKQVSQ
jgi:hypothetical protein